MAVYTYRNTGTNQVVYVRSAVFAGNPLWELVSGPGGGGGDVTQAELDALEADTTGPHGVPDFADLVTDDEANAKVIAHSGATDPHGDRAYTDTASDLLIPLTQRAAANGVATLDSDGKIPVGQVPSVTVVEAGRAPSAPLTTAGLPDGVSLTATSGLPAADATESLVLTHPLTGESVTLSVSVWRRRRWTATLNPTVPAGQTYLFDQCEFDVASDNFCVDVAEDNGVADQMAPLIVFRRCRFDGNDTTGKCLVASYVWLIDSDLGHCEDGWAGGSYSVATGSNIVAATDGLADPHSDGVQNSGGGTLDVVRCWLSAGTDPAAWNAALRIGTEFSAVAGVRLFYCGLDAGGYTLQMRGDAGAGDITGVQVVGCRWVDNATFGPVDFEQTTVSLWLDNAFVDGTPILNPVP